jgi:hypothetical protein
MSHHESLEKIPAFKCIQMHTQKQLFDELNEKNKHFSKGFLKALIEN